MNQKKLTYNKLYNAINSYNSHPTIGDSFKFLVESIIHIPEERTFSLIQNIFFASTLIESIIKEVLIEVNPALVLKTVEIDDIIILLDKKDLLLKPKENHVIICDDLKKLIARGALVNDVILRYETGLYSFFKIRNSLVHPLYANEIDFYNASTALFNQAIPFIENYIEIEESLWRDFLKVKTVIHDEFRENLVKVIIKHQTLAKRFNKFEVEELRTKIPQLDITESFIEKRLLCIACKNLSLDYISGVDFEQKDGGVLAQSYEYCKCRVCDIVFDNYKIDEIITNSKLYITNPKEILEWESAYRLFHEHHEYDDIDYEEELTDENFSK